MNHVRNRVNGKFRPLPLMDAGYSSEPLRLWIKRQYRTDAIIKPNAAHKKAVKLHSLTPEEKITYHRRISVEQAFGRLKCHRKLNSIRVRGIDKVTLHCFLSVIVLQSQAVATNFRALMRKVA